MRARLLRENIEFKRGQEPKEALGIGRRPLFFVMSSTQDYTNMDFYIEESEAKSKYDENDDENVILGRVKGEGNLYLGSDFGSSGDVSIIESKFNEPEW